MLKDVMTRIGLTVNETKTKLREARTERFDFLGYDFGRYYSPKTGRAYLCPQPSKASVKRVIGKIRHATARNVLWLSAEEMVTGLNRVLVGWANYYSLGPVYKAYRAIDRYTPLPARSPARSARSWAPWSPPAPRSARARSKSTRCPATWARSTGTAVTLFLPRVLGMLS